jgi:hypothetical protein
MTHQPEFMNATSEAWKTLYFRAFGNEEDRGDSTLLTPWRVNSVNKACFYRVF